MIDRWITRMRNWKGEGKKHLFYRLWKENKLKNNQSTWYEYQGNVSGVSRQIGYIEHSLGPKLRKELEAAGLCK
jgi:hypothetical protein